MNSPTRVLIVDDHELVRAGLRGVLDTEALIEVVAEAADGLRALAAVEVHHPDVIVMDLQMPGMGGVEATRRILASRPETAVLVVTMFDDDDSVFAAVRAGARGYVLKGAGRQELRAAVMSVASGQTVFGPGVAAKIMEAMAGGREHNELFPELTGRERQVLELLVEGYTPPAAGRRLGITEKTVRNNVSSVLTKLHVEDRRAAVELARQRGLAGPPATEHRALLYADIENATTLVRQHASRYAQLLADHNRILDAAITAQGGRSFGIIGDTRFAWFPDPISAITAAVATLRNVAGHQFPGGIEPKLRIGVHTGTVTDYGAELVGIALHETARVAATAAGCQVRVSDDAHTGATALPPDIHLRDLGMHELPDVDRPLRLFAAEPA